MTEERGGSSGRYRWSGWAIDGVSHADISAARLTETHEYFHRQLDDLTAFGGLVAVCASLAAARPDGRWTLLRDRVQAMSDIVHETYAVGMSLLTTQRRVAPVDGYPMYDRYVTLVRRLVGDDTHPWVALAALRSVATVCMQSPAVAYAADIGLEAFRGESIPVEDRPNHRLVWLTKSGFREVVENEQQAAADAHGREAWWIGSAGITLTPESMDGEAGARSRALHERLFAAAAAALGAHDARVLDEDAHHDDLRRVLAQARDLVPDGLSRIGALVESPGADLLHGGALDSQTITLTAAPRKASVLPYGSLSGMSGEGPSRHGFVTVVRPVRIASLYEVNGVALPAEAAAAFMRSTVFDGPVRHSLLFLIVDEPASLDEGEVPIFVSVSSSAAAAAPDVAARWMRHADPSRLSLVMDTPATPALHRWCSDEQARFRTATRQITADGVDLRIIAGRVEHERRRSPLVIIPTTEFGARWFEAATHEDALLNRAVVVDRDLFEEESEHMAVVLTHLILEEPVVGTGSWNA
jgi:hypothetical protein